MKLRGKVTKVSENILGHNWVHLGDGSGSADAGTDDLTVTTQEVVSKGDVVVFEGVVATDKDFGAGYSFPVLMEDASITTE